MNSQRTKNGTRKKSSTSDSNSDKSGAPQVQASGLMQPDANNWINNSKSNDPLSERSQRLSKELEDFVERGMVGITANEKGEENAPTTEAASELQIQIARMFRQIFPGNRELLYLVQEKNWMALLLNWMNQYDRPKVQVEAMLALTTITELCQQELYQNPPAMGVDASPFSTGLDTIHNPFKRPSSMGGNSQNKVAKNKTISNVQSTNVNPGDASTVANRVKFIMDKSKEIYDKLPNKTENAPMLKSFQNLIHHYASNPNSRNIFPDDLYQQISSLDQDLDRDGFQEDFDDIQNESDVTLSTEEIASQLPDLTTIVDQTVRMMDKDWDKSTKVANVKNVTTSSTVTAAPPSKELLNSMSSSWAAMKKEGSDPASKFLTPPGSSLSSGMINTLQNLPQLSSMSSNPIPLAGNYKQPLSVSSNNLLVRHPEAIPSFISLMTSPDKDVCENAMWVVGNIASGETSAIPGTTGNVGDSKSSNVTVKDIVLAAGAMSPLLRCMEKFHDTLSLQRIGSWVISTLVETKIPPGRKGPEHNSRIEDIDIEQLMNTLRRLIYLEDNDILSYTCWSLSHLCDGPASNIMSVVTSADTKDPPGGLVPRLIELLHHSNWRVTKPALRTIGNIVCAEYDDSEMASATEDGDPFLTDFTEVILDCNAVPTLKDLINHSNREIQKEACWTLSNIAAGTVDQIQAVINAGAIPPLVQLVNDESTDQEVRSEACWVVLNATSCGSDSQISSLVSEGCVSVLGLLLEETNMVTMALEGLERVLQVEEAREEAYLKDGSKGEHPKALVTASLIEKAMTKKHSSAVNKRAQKIWNDHFVSCALCHLAFSKHRKCDAKFCEECKCHVCSNCNCEIYHLSYQQELWADTEQSNEGKSKKSKNKKKKDKKKNKAKTQDSKDSEKEMSKTMSDEVVSPVDDNNKDVTPPEIVNPSEQKVHIKEEETKVADSTSIGSDDESEEELYNTERDKPMIDFSLYLQQTGSIIALARLMDALDEGTVAAEDFRVLQ